MTKMEIIKKIEKLENQQFMIYMTDHWTTQDKDLLRKVENELKELKRKLN